jgi:hypothetical protein
MFHLLNLMSLFISIDTRKQAYLNIVIILVGVFSSQAKTSKYLSPAHTYLEIFYIGTLRVGNPNATASSFR